MKILLASIITLATLTCACSSVYRPKPAIPNQYKTQVLTDITSKTLLKDYNAMPQDTLAQKTAKVARRNQILIELIYLVDKNYYSFENRFYGTQATFSTAADAATLGLTAAGAVIGEAS